MNRQWHSEHVLGSGASMDERVVWHLEHQQACGCRPVPPSVERAISEGEWTDGSSR